MGTVLLCFEMITPGNGDCFLECTKYLTNRTSITLNTRCRFTGRTSFTFTVRTLTRNRVFCYTGTRITCITLYTRTVISRHLITGIRYYITYNRFINDRFRYWFRDRFWFCRNLNRNFFRCWNDIISWCQGFILCWRNIKHWWNNVCWWSRFNFWFSDWFNRCIFWFNLCVIINYFSLTRCGRDYIFFWGNNWILCWFYNRVNYLLIIFFHNSLIKSYVIKTGLQYVCFQV